MEEMTRKEARNAASYAPLHHAALQSPGSRQDDVGSSWSGAAWSCRHGPRGRRDGGDDVDKRFTRGEIDVLGAPGRAGLREVSGGVLMMVGGMDAVADGLGMV